MHSALNNEINDHASSLPVSQSTITFILIQYCYLYSKSNLIETILRTTMMTEKIEMIFKLELSACSNMCMIFFFILYQYMLDFMTFYEHISHFTQMCTKSDKNARNWSCRVSNFTMQYICREIYAQKEENICTWNKSTTYFLLIFLRNRIATTMRQTFS